jgi:hypothetical protein
LAKEEKFFESSLCALVWQTQQKTKKKKKIRIVVVSRK